MSRIRLIMLSLLAVLAVGAVASASASAAALVYTCGKPGGFTWKFETETKCFQGVALSPADGPWERLDLPSGTLVLGLGGLSILTSKLDSVTITIHCLHVDLHGKLEANGLISGLVLTYLQCTITGKWEAKCEVAATLSTNKLMGTASVSGRQETTFEPEGSTFIEIVIKAKGEETCAIASTYPIKGSQTCSIDKTEKEAEEGKTEHEIICTTSGSKLKLGPEAATYEGSAAVKMEGKTWAVTG